MKNLIQQKRHEMIAYLDKQQANVILCSETLLVIRRVMVERVGWMEPCHLHFDRGIFNGDFDNEVWMSFYRDDVDEIVIIGANLHPQVKTIIMRHGPKVKCTNSQGGRAPNVINTIGILRAETFNISDGMTEQVHQILEDFGTLWLHRIRWLGNTKKVD